MAKQNPYSGGDLDRADHLRGHPDWRRRIAEAGEAKVLAVWRDRNLIAGEGEDEQTPEPLHLALEDLDRLGPLVRAEAFLGFQGGVALLAVDLAEEEDLEDAPPPPLPDGRFEDLRRIGPLIGQAEGSALAYARGLMYWHRRHRFCGACGHPTAITQAGHERRCTNEACRARHFPRTDPAVIMLVHDGGERCLLGRQANWPAGRYSTLAGFVEPGESLEEAVAREVQEETGVEVTDVRYHSSQPWPFPSSIMLGFHARATSEAITVNDAELEDARWATREELLNPPADGSLKLPSRDSIARRLILDWLGKED